MPAEDVLHSVAISGNTTERRYTQYRIDYNDDVAISELVDTDSFEVGFKNPPAGYPGHEAYGNYQRKVLISEGSDADAARDAVVAALDEGYTYTDDEGNEIEVRDIGTTVEDVTPVEDERAACEDYGAMNSLEGHDAERWAQAVEDLDAGHITMTDFEHGRNPKRGYEFGGPGNKGRGKQKAGQAGPPDHVDRPAHPVPLKKANGNK